MTSAELIAQLETRRDTIIGLINTANADGRDLPNNNGGNNVDHIGKIRAWYEELKLIDEQINSLDGAFEVVSEMTA